MQMKSDCYVCDIDVQLGATKLEDYEIKNGMSIERETFLLKLVAKELLVKPLQKKAC